MRASSLPAPPVPHHHEHVSTSAGEQKQPRRAPGPSPPLPGACRGPGSCGGRSCDDQELGLLAVVGWADATENGRAGCAPIWASSPTCVPQPTPKNSASRVARCPPRAPLDQQSSNGVAIAPGGRALCAAASARYLAGAARPSSSIRTTRGGSITPSTAPVMLRKCCIFFSGKNESSGSDSGRFVLALDSSLGPGAVQRRRPGARCVRL